MCELQVPAMIHVSGSCNPAMHATGGYYLAADTVAFMQLLQGDLFSRFPELKLIIPHGGGAVPYHCALRHIHHDEGKTGHSLLPGRNDRGLALHRLGIEEPPFGILVPGARPQLPITAID